MEVDEKASLCKLHLSSWFDLIGDDVWPQFKIDALQLVHEYQERTWNHNSKSNNKNGRYNSHLSKKNKLQPSLSMIKD